MRELFHILDEARGDDGNPGGGQLLQARGGLAHGEHDVRGLTAGIGGFSGAGVADANKGKDGVAQGDVPL